jgi:crotonobetainyl-CoA:carnitine CoA-transferase CaiB-like acyl-CoA transferase
MGGLMSITGAPGESPIRVGIPVADLTAGLFCTVGILTALLERDFSGEGQWVQASSRAVFRRGVQRFRDESAFHHLVLVPLQEFRPTHSGIAATARKG